MNPVERLLSRPLDIRIVRVEEGVVTELMQRFQGPAKEMFYKANDWLADVDLYAEETEYKAGNPHFHLVVKNQEHRWPTDIQMIVYEEGAPGFGMENSDDEARTAAQEAATKEDAKDQGSAGPTPGHDAADPEEAANRPVPDTNDGVPGECVSAATPGGAE